MTRSRVWPIPANLVLNALLLVFAPALRAQGGPAPAAGFHLYGTTVVNQLPPPGKIKGKLKHNLFRVANSDVFRAQKTEADSGRASASRATAGPATPSTLSVNSGSGFDGASYDEQVNLLGLGVTPPDTQVAAGAGFVVEVVNIYAHIYNMNVSPPTVTTFDLIDFFGAYFSDLISDPRIRFDAVHQRWYLSCSTAELTLVNPGQGDFRLAVSTSSDPTLAFTLYAATTGGSFPDYPHLGFNEDKLVLTGNSFAIAVDPQTGFNAISNQFLGTEFLVASLSDLLNPANPSPHTQFFGADQGLDTIQPAESLSSTCSGGVCTLYMASVPDAPATFVRVWSLNGVPGVGGGATFTTKDLNLSTTLTIPPGGVQQGSANLIETNDNRLLDAIFRNGRLSLSANTGCTPAGDVTIRSCMYFAQVDTSSLTMAQDFVFGAAGEYYYYPAIQVDANNNLVAVFNRSSSTEYPSIYVSGQPAGAPAGTFETPILVLAGQFPLTPSPCPSPCNGPNPFNRWGDYSGAHLDSSGLIVWVGGQYVHSAADDDWGTWLASVQVSGGLTPTATTLGSSLNPSTYGSPVTFTAMVAPGAATGTVTFKDGSTALDVETLSGGAATSTPVNLTLGPHSITAVYGGDTNFAGSTSTVWTQTVNPAMTTTTLGTSGSPSVFGQLVTFTATVTSGAPGTPGGNVTFKDGSTTIGTMALSGGAASFATSTLSVGSPHSITAIYAGAGNFAGSTSSAVVQAVNKANTNASVTASLNPIRAGKNVTFTAIVTTAAPGGGTPAGNVQFNDGNTTLSTKALNGSGHATFATSKLSRGAHSITVVYLGNANYNGTTSPVLVQTVK